MFLKKLFNFSKDYSHYLEKGDRLLTDERFAEARIAYSEALEKLEANREADLSQVEAVRKKIALTGNQLGHLNLVEAEYALNSGDRTKAEEHVRIIMELADDQTLRGNAERLLAKIDAGVPEEIHVSEVLDYGSCRETKDESGNENHAVTDANITGEDRVTLFFQTLPGDLPERYAEMGAEFARACLLNLEGNEVEALRIFEELSTHTANDILEYEKAILYFNNGDAVHCEQLLTRALGMNPGNPLCNIGLVQLYIETGRDPEALQVLERMITGDIIPEQAKLMQGDLYIKLEDESSALESYSSLLASPQFAREASERVIPLLQKQGRTKEAANLAKRFARGCC
ncbi:MAG TPA: hypothetical protein PLI53_00745 [Geobacteraceae bacterium]|nr:hypothetical protein [Geobacteraceae bacterium]